MKRVFNINTLLISMGLAVAFLGGFVLGLEIGYTDGSQTTTKIRNQMLDFKPYDASLEIKNLEYLNISPAGFTILFDTNKTTGTVIYANDVKDLVCEWVVYPSDIFFTADVKIQVFRKQGLRADIEKYPEGGTVMFRIVDIEKNYGSLWFYIDLPRPNDSNLILPPPYMPTGKG